MTRYGGQTLSRSLNAITPPDGFTAPAFAGAFFWPLSFATCTLG
jgi:hypothetical protein